MIWEEGTFNHQPRGTAALPYNVPVPGFRPLSPSFCHRLRFPKSTVIVFYLCLAQTTARRAELFFQPNLDVEKRGRGGRGSFEPESPWRVAGGHRSAESSEVPWGAGAEGCSSLKLFSLDICWAVPAATLLQSSCEAWSRHWLGLGKIARDGAEPALAWVS